jgi:hypothetical protein
MLSHPSSQLTISERGAGQRAAGDRLPPAGHRGDGLFRPAVHGREGRHPLDPHPQDYQETDCQAERYTE